MKKTLLITLCALAFPAMADNFTLDYTQGEAVKVTNASPTLIDSTVLTLTDVSLTYPGGGTPAVIGGDGNASTYVSHFYAPWLNFKNNAQGWTYTLTFITPGLIYWTFRHGRQHKPHCPFQRTFSPLPVVFGVCAYVA